MGLSIVYLAFPRTIIPLPTFFFQKAMLLPRADAALQSSSTGKNAFLFKGRNQDIIVLRTGITPLLKFTEAYFIIL